MAEASATQHWRSRRNLQVIWLIDEIYNTFYEATKFSTQRLLDLGDELDDESLFHFSLSFPSWQTRKEATGLDKKELFKLLKDNSVKTFTTRIIFMKMIYSKDKSEYERLRKKEIDHILDTLNRQDKCCELVRLKEKGIVLHQESVNDIFETLALGFEESNIMAEIMEELIMKQGNVKYKVHDRKNWIQTVLKKKTPIPWDPLVFYVCANKYKCVVSIQANDTDEYRFYPETVSNKPIIKFARTELSKYMCLKRDQEVFDCVTVAGCYTSYKQKMRDTIKGQLAEMREDQETKNIKDDPNEDLIDAQTTCFKKLVSEKKDLKENVSILQTSLDETKAQEKEMVREKKDLRKNIRSLKTSLEEAIEQKKEAIEQKLDTERSYDQLSEMLDEFWSRKSKLDEETKQNRQRRNLSSASNNKNPNEQKEMNQAQDCSTNSVQVTTKRKSQSKTEDTITPVGD